MTNELTVTLANRRQELERLAAQIAEFCAGHRLSEDIAYAFTLSLDEVITNVISYAYADTRQREIEVRLRLERAVVRAEIEDDGRAFNPLAIPAPDLDAAIDQRPIGGLGLHIVRSMMDVVEYRRQGGHNVLTLIKRLQADT